MQYRAPTFWIVLAAVAGVASAQDPPAEFTGASFPCKHYTASEASDSPTHGHVKLSRLWVHGYLAGLYQATEILRFSDTTEETELLEKAIEVQCGEYPEASLLAVAQGTMAPAKIAMPREATAGLPVDRYTCAEHLDAGKKGETDRAELAGWWAFAFIQGYKSAEKPDMVIELENRPVLTAAVERNCEKNRDATFLELTTLVAHAVKLE